jgi:hypothetical protein
MVAHGPFTKAVGEVAGTVMPVLDTANGRRRTSRRRAIGAPVTAR